MTLSSLLKKVKDFFSNCGQIRRTLQIGSYLLKKVLMENLMILKCLIHRIFEKENFLTHFLPYAHKTWQKMGSLTWLPIALQYLGH